ncbi:MAG TPA: cytochrome c oxidase subunit II [Opitutaceae bacterium]
MEAKPPSRILRGVRASAARILRRGGSCVAAGLTGCRGPQSALAPAGSGAADIAELFWWMAAGAGVVWIAVLALAAYAARARLAERQKRWAAVLIIGGGAALPTVVLTSLLIYGLSLMPRLLARAPDASLRIRVVGEQWWWRVHYRTANGDSIELANEIRLPVGEPVEFELESPDVIHSFWIPALGGKMDMIPGRQTRLTLEPTRTGVFRGVCAEFCGTAHTFMAFTVVVLERAEFDRWLAGQQQPAVEPAGSRSRGGRERFFANGCSACHAVRGTEAKGTVGPDLTHVGSRLTLGAALLPNDAAGFVRWLEQTDGVKPGVHMPHFRMLPREELDTLAAYLDALQ